jgi:two-component system sensor histidine kinase/response regulator
MPVFDAGREVGRIEVERSLRPALLGAGLATLLSALLAGAVFIALRLLPLRALRKAERKATEQAAHAAFLEKQHREVREDARIKNHLLARLTHEIRTPLGGLLGMTESLRAAPMSTAQRRQAQRAHESGAALLQVVDDILDYSKLQSNDVTVERQLFDPVPLVESVIELLTPRAEAAGLSLYYQVGPGLPAEMEGDPARLRQVLNNLVGNALKFTQRGDVKVIVSWVAATMTSPAGVHFEVRDTGMGLSPEEQSRLFRPALQIDEGAARQGGGAGLGLVICRQLVQLMGGQIGLQSRVGRGSNFWFELPQEQAHVRFAQALPTDASGLPMHVLVADPQTGRARALCCRLLALGVRVNAVHNAVALRTVLAKPRHLFTHVLALDSLQVNPGEAPHLRWVTLHDSSLQNFDWSEEGSSVSLNLPCRRDDLVQALLEARPLSEAPADLGDATYDRHTWADDVGTASPLPRHDDATSVLLVEGNEVSQEVGRALLESMGCEVHIAADGHEALQRLPQGFALILLDLQMSGMDGYTTAREIRLWESRQADARRTPLVALTADNILDVQDRCSAAGLDDVVGKPVNLETLRETLERYLPELATV